MSFSHDLKRDFRKHIVDIGIGAAGFLYKSMLAAVQNEATENQGAMPTTYEDLNDKDAMWRDYSTAIISQALANPLFVKHASSTQLAIFTDYLREATSANNYRHTVELYFCRLAAKSLVRVRGSNKGGLPAR
jgi:hypothetical protein